MTSRGNRRRKNAKPSPAAATSELERGRDAYARRDFLQALEALSAADRTEALSGEDLERLALSAGLLGRDEELLRTWERAHHAHLEAGNPVGAARAAFWLASRLGGGGEKARAGGWLARGQRLLDEAGLDCVERGYYLIATARRHLESSECEPARATAIEAARIGDRFGDPDLVAFGRLVEGQSYLRQERIPQGLTLLDEAMVAVSSGELSPLVTGLVYCSVIRACQDVYALGRAREWTEALKSWCDTQPGSASFTGFCLVHRSEILQLNGDWEEASQEARIASERLLAGFDERAAAPAFYQQAELHRLRGEFAEAEEAYTSASRRGSEPQPGLALLRLAQGRTEAAASAMRRVVAAATGRMARTRLLPAHVEIMLAAGDREEARRAATELGESARKLDMEIVHAMAAHATGLVALSEGDAKAALEPLRQAFEIWQRFGAPYLAARVRVAIARACHSLGDADGCRLEVDAARAVFAALGAAPDLAALDGSHGPSASGRPHGLTDRELQVLRLVAAGRTNRAIATELFLSEKTVDRHVSNIFDKLNVASRAAATAFAYEHRLV